jgi:hypothetical protein
MITTTPNRRTVLKAAAATVALPWLESLAAAGKPPVRLAFCFMPNGIYMPDWTPKKVGKLELSPTLKTFKGLEKEVSILSGLAHNNARAHGDGPGDHARSSAAFLTAAHPFKTGGRDIRCGISIDQLIGQRNGHLTSLPSLELGCERGGSVGICDSGYACAYVDNISWRNETTPVPKITAPAAAFERLFGAAPDLSQEEIARRRAQRLSVLDFVREDAKQLNSTLSAADRERVSDYFDALRDVEKRLQDPRLADIPANANHQRFAVPPENYRDQFRLMADLIVLAFQLDVTRVVSFMPGRGGSNRNFEFIGVPDGHHHLSHHRGDQSMIDDIRKIDRFHAEQFAYLIRKLKSTREGNQSLLDNCAVVLGSGIGDGNRHRHEDLPTLVAGSAGGRLTTGVHRQYERDTPLANLFLTLLQSVNVMDKRFGDSTAALKV